MRGFHRQRGWGQARYTGRKAGWSLLATSPQGSSGSLARANRDAPV